MLGTIVNTLSIIAGSLIGLIFKGGIPEKYTRTVMHAIGLAVVLIGIRTAMKTDQILVVILSLAVGSILGEWLRIEDRLEKLGNWIGGRLGKDSQGVRQRLCQRQPALLRGGHGHRGVPGERPLRKPPDPVSPSRFSTASGRWCLPRPWASAFCFPRFPFLSIRASSP